ncbi:Lipase, required for intravacuolar lysis of autophagic bodies [Serpula lacrymans var. lacrymans S7.3]|uniref:triacylglycerol lipase n=2 Tax=Serpula lacrymans var. lacrymans TaxID=341189 RepID=F8Q7G7_SERL3|nr:lipase [Serpula lacrymans var. lacrymans S7.9]EGN95505.1 Lipase, required for intravacuolar lysis of autophagic bodies [Serpula lacrymans var. lacrymans S7.3]EGO21032.1 lipase [Serpula lacrymans var. lacrymans S7.9]
MLSLHFITFTSFLLAASVLGSETTPSNTPASTTLTFNPLLQYHITQDRHTQHLLAGDYNSAIDRDTPPTYTLKARPTTVYRPSSFEAVEKARLRSLHHAQSEPVEWVEQVVHGPDIEDRHTLVQLARMAGDAYQLPGRKNWYDIDPSWNINASFPFGWEDDEDGFRGFVFRSHDNDTIVLSIKGTTLQGPTSKKDKYNDNLLFSCCCARVDFTWIFSTVCDCYSSSWRCDDTCLSDALIQDSLFYSTGVDLVYNLTSLYPSANVWLVGHSLGGAIASLLGSTFGLPAVAFESPGERLAAKRLHLPLPPGPPPRSLHPEDGNTNALPRVPVTHVYHNADPIPQGACTGILSPCAQAGYALETHCHLGRSIVYDTVGRLGWRVDVRKHVIKEMILNVLEVEGQWPDDEEGKEREVPRAKEELDCVDCFKWEFGDFKDAVLLN